MSLQPPTEPIEDPGAHELVESSDDHFSDASEGQEEVGYGGRNRAISTASIPVTRVEKVDDEPRHGEVPGTEAYNIRIQDAVPDEIEIVPEGSRSRSTSRLSESDRPLTPGGTPVPKIIAEKIDPSVPGYGDVPGTAAHDMRQADAQPDEVVQAPSTNRAHLDRKSFVEPQPPPSLCLTKKVSPTPNDRSRPPSPSPLDQPSMIESVTESLQEPLPSPQEQQQQQQQQIQQSQSQSQSQSQFQDQQPPNTQSTSIAKESADDFDDPNNDQIDDDGFGDFDNFEEGAQAEDDDFGDFDETPVAAPVAQAPPPPVAHPLAHLPNLHFADLQTSDDILEAMTPYMSGIFPELYTADSELKSVSAAAALPTDPILTDRSASLWSQLVAPPPLQPPNWIRSRIRRLFLVSLGVPVDLDEILPASKQKKLVLPNIHLSSESTTDNKTQKQKQEPARKGPPPPPAFDANAATLIASSTDTAVEAYTDDELKTHVARLEELISDASTVLEHWVRRKESAIGDKEAFEGVIENLVGFVKSRR